MDTQAGPGLLKDALSIPIGHMALNDIGFVTLAKEIIGMNSNRKKWRFGWVTINQTITDASTMLILKWN